MARMNTNIPLSVQQPDIVGSMHAGTQAAAGANQVRRSNAVNQLYQDFGAGIARGDRGALDKLAQFDPAQAQQISASHDRLKLAKQAGARAAASAARSAEQRAQLEAEFSTMRQGALAYDQAKKGDPSAFAAWSQANGGVSMESFPVFLATAQGGMEMLQRMGAGQQYGQPEQPKSSAAQQKIGRLMEQGLDERSATMISDGVWTTSRDPLTGQVVVIDRSTGQPVNYQQAAPQPEPVPAPPGGDAYSGGDQAFGAEGFLKNAANTVTDAVGIAQPYPGAAQAMADFKVLQEKLLADIANGYQRQPPSWLLQNIRELTPEPGRFFKGPEQATQKLKALSRSLAEEQAAAISALSGRLSPDERQAMEARRNEIDRARIRISGAIAGIASDGYSQAASDGAQRTSSGVKYRVID